MHFNEAEQRRLDRELACIRPMLAWATPARQEELLDEAFERAGLDPTWAEWLSVAGLVLPARRARRAQDAD